MSASVLEREMFTEAEAARLLRVPQRTLNYWLEGGEVRGRAYRPIIRTEPRGGHAAVTWAEFVEAGLLREYRQTHRIPMAELRGFVDQMRSRFGVPYPLADQRPFASGKEMLSVAQDDAGLNADLCLVATVRGQYVLTPAADTFYKRVTWEGDTAVAWRPHDDPLSPVLMRPGLRAGRPAVKGISTEILWEHEEWLIITRDRHIQDHRAEIEAVRSSGARMVNLAADDATDRFAQMEVIMCQWRRICALLDEQGRSSTR